VSLDYQDQVRFVYVEPDDDDPPVQPRCVACGCFMTIQPTGDVRMAEFPDEPDPIWECQRCHRQYTADEVYP
jgi:hypothetical protein